MIAIAIALKNPGAEIISTPHQLAGDHTFESRDRQQSDEEASGIGDLGNEQDCRHVSLPLQDVSASGSSYQAQNEQNCKLRSSTKPRIVTPAPPQAFGSSQIWTSFYAADRSDLNRALLRGPGASQVLPHFLEIACTGDAALPFTKALAETGGYSGAHSRPDLLRSHFARAQTLDRSAPLLKHW